MNLPIANAETTASGCGGQCECRATADATAAGPRIVLLAQWTGDNLDDLFETFGGLIEPLSERTLSVRAMSGTTYAEAGDYLAVTTSCGVFVLPGAIMARDAPRVTLTPA